MYLIEHVFKDTEDGQLLKTTMEVEDDKAKRTWKKDHRQPKDKRKLKIAKEGIEKRHEYSLMSRSNKGIYTVKTLEVMGLSLQFLFSDYEPVLIVNGHEIVLKGHKGALMERTLSKGFIMEDGRIDIHKEDSVQRGATSPVALKTSKKGSLYGPLLHETNFHSSEAKSPFLVKQGLLSRYWLIQELGSTMLFPKRLVIIFVYLSFTALFSGLSPVMNYSSIINTIIRRTRMYTILTLSITL